MRIKLAYLLIIEKKKFRSTNFNITDLRYQILFNPLTNCHIFLLIIENEKKGAKFQFIVLFVLTEAKFHFKGCKFK